MKKNIYSFLLIFIIIFLATQVNSQPPQQQSAQIAGLTIETPIIEVIKIGEDFEFHAHIYNDSNGYEYAASEVDFCNIHIYEPTEGEHLIQDQMQPNGNGIDFEYKVLGGNFTENRRQYAALIYCEVTDLAEPRGGFIQFGFDVTTTGQILTTASSFNFFVVILLIIFICSAIGFIGIKSKNQVLSITFISFSILILVYSLGMTLNFLESDIGSYESFDTNVSTLYVLLVVLLIAGGLALILYLIYVALNYYWSMRGITDKFNV